MTKGAGKSRLLDRLSAWWAYVSAGVWHDRRDTLGVRITRMLNLSVRAFFDRGLQLKSMALTYSTVLAIVPALALLFAIGRGFGFQNILSDSLFKAFPSQQQALTTAFTFVDSYLKHASQGIFVGVGVVVLLWTLISLLSGIEDAFNNIWDIKTERTLFRKISDYITILILVPVLMVCSSGITIFLSTSLQDNLSLPFLTPVISTLLDLIPFILCWLAFTLSFALIPNTKVKFKYAAITGLLAMISFQILQYLFVNGQIYVSKYNAIYGSFAFLPLLLVWLQLSWLILLSGCVLTYSLQNVFGYNFLGDMTDIAPGYMRRVTLVVTTIIIKRFEQGEPPLSAVRLAEDYELPMRLVANIAQTLVDCQVVYQVVNPSNPSDPLLAPAVDNDTFTVGDLLEKIDTHGNANFIPRFARNYAPLLRAANMHPFLNDTLLRDLPLPEVKSLKKQSL